MPRSLGGDVESREQPVEKRHDLLRRHLRCQRREADQVGEGDGDLGEAVGDPLLAAAQPVGDRCRQDVQQQFLVLAILVLDHDILFAQILDHAVEGRAELADLVARADRHARPVVAGSEAFHPGSELAQRSEQRA